MDTKQNYQIVLDRTLEEIGKSDYMNARKEIAVAAESGSELIGTVYM